MTVTNHMGGKEPLSRKKLEQGDGNFETKKEMIGFLFDGVKCNMRLPAEKAKAYIKEAHKVLRRKSVPLKKMQALVGKLQHASVILLAAKRFFTPINMALRGSRRSLAETVLRYPRSPRGPHHFTPTPQLAGYARG